MGGWIFWIALNWTVVSFGPGWLAWGFTVLSVVGWVWYRFSILW